MTTDFRLCECGHSNDVHKEIDDNYTPCSIYSCNCDDFNEVEITEKMAINLIRVFESEIRSFKKLILDKSAIVENLKKSLK